MSLRIDILTNLYPPDVSGGYELLARDVVHGLAARGHVVNVLTTGTERGEQGITRSLCLARPFGEPSRMDRGRHFTAAIRNRIATQSYLRRNGRPDVLLVMSLRRLGLEPLRVFRRAGVSAVATVNDDWPAAYCPPRHSTWRAALDRHVSSFRLLRSNDVSRVMWLSEAVRAQMMDAGAPLAPGRVEYQGVDCSQFSPLPVKIRDSSRSQPFKLLFVGRLHPSKGPDVALDALAVVLSRGCDAELIIVGEADNPEYEAALKRQAHNLGVSSRVSWRGKLDRELLPEVYRSADLLLFVSRLMHEGQGLTYLEAMASGIPVVASPSGGAREFLTRYPIARLTKSCDGDSFADEIIEFMQHPDRASQLVSEALVVVRRQASLETYIDAIAEELYAAARTEIVRSPLPATCTDKAVSRFE